MPNLGGTRYGESLERTVMIELDRYPQLLNCKVGLSRLIAPKTDFPIQNLPFGMYRAIAGSNDALPCLYSDWRPRA
jgi:hypothetical protein